MKRTFKSFVRGLMVVVLSLVLSQTYIMPVQAETCTWEGDTSINWFTIANWSCGRVPEAGDDVVISSGTTYQPTIVEPELVTVNAITVNANSTLTIQSASYGSKVDAATWTIDGVVVARTGEGSVWINYHDMAGSGIVNVSSTGTITKLGTGSLVIFSTFNNAGSLIFTEHGSSESGIYLIRGGNHTGSFQGYYLNLGENYYVSGQTFNFNTGSEINVNELVVQGGTVNIYGKYSQPEDTGTRLYISKTYTGTCVVYLKTGAEILKTPENTFIFAAKLILENEDYDYNMTKLSLDYMGELQNLGNLNIANQFLWNQGKLTGIGTTAVDATATFTMGVSTYPAIDFTLDGQTLINETTANWDKRDLTLTNSAEFINNGAFNANATTTMIGGETESFVNNGSFVKDNLDTTTTTTTMDIPFTNNGTVDVVAGELIFQQGMENGEDAIIDLGGGTLNPGDTLTLEVGDSLIGSGILAANLVNGGTVSPGNSAGIITVDGDYTQETTGTLEIQLGGTTAGTGYDQLTVTGTATMAGVLDLSLINGFEPQVGDSFTILPYGTRSGGYSSLNLPEGYRWGIDYGYSGLTLSVLPGGSISGNVTCDSPHTVFVDLWVDDYTSPPPEDSTTIACGESYSFTNLPDGTYFVGAWIDLNESGNGPPDEGEPYAWYGDPMAVTIIDGEIKENIDITIEGGGYTLFLPMALK